MEIFLTKGFGGLQAAAPQPGIFLAFGSGPRVCPGQDLAKTSALVFLHRLVLGYRYCRPRHHTAFLLMFNVELHDDLRNFRCELLILYLPISSALLTIIMPPRLQVGVVGQQ